MNLETARLTIQTAAELEPSGIRINAITVGKAKLTGADGTNHPAAQLEK